MAPHRLRNVAHLSPLAYVADEALHIHIGGVELGMGGCEGAFLHIEHSHVDPSPGERPHHAEADAGGGAGDDGDLVLHVVHDLSLVSCHASFTASEHRQRVGARRSPAGNVAALPQGRR